MTKCSQMVLPKPQSYKQKGCMNAYQMRLYLRLVLQSLLFTGEQR